MEISFVIQHLKNPQADHDGENYHFHLTIVYGKQSAEIYMKAYEELCQDTIYIETVVNRLGLLYYQNNDGVGKFITYKINKLKER